MTGYFLLIDAGNTRTKWAKVQSGQWHCGSPLMTQSVVSSALDDAWGDLETPLGIALSNVAGQSVEADITSFIQRKWSTELFIAKSQNHAYGVTSGYREAERLGVDRWLALIAARARSSRPTVIVDAGSACTIDLLDQDGRHLGGYILPGLSVMGDALVNRTYQIQEAKLINQCTLDPGVDTLEGMASGTLLALVGAVERVLYNLQNKGVSEPSILLTGGDAEKLATLLRYSSDMAPDLVLEGLWRCLGAHR